MEYESPTFNKKLKLIKGALKSMKSCRVPSSPPIPPTPPTYLLIMISYGYRFIKTWSSEITLKISAVKLTLHKKWSLPLRIFSVNVTKSAGLRIWSHLLKKSLIENFIFLCSANFKLHAPLRSTKYLSTKNLNIMQCFY